MAASVSLIVVRSSEKRQEVAMVQRMLQITGKGDIQALGVNGKLTLYSSFTS